MRWKLFFVCILLISAVQVVNAEETNLTYSGYLSSDGSPTSGDYAMEFRLYDVETGGSSLDSYSTTVSVENGYFTTELKFDKEYFDGRPLWLGIQVEDDSEMNPRIKLNEVPYSTSPKFLITEQQVNFTGLEVKEGLSVNTTKDDVQGVYSNTTGDYSDGVFARTYGESSPGVFARTEGYGSDGFFARTEGVHSDGVYAYTEGVHSEGVYAKTSGNYSEGVYARTYGEDSPALYGESSKSYGVYGEGNYGGYFTTNQPGEVGEINAAIKAETDGDSSRGVYANTTGESSKGFYARTEGYDSEGFFARTEGDNSEGVYAYSNKSYGVHGIGRYGGYFTTNQPGEQFEKNAAIKAETDGDWSRGVYANTSGEGSEGVHARTEGVHSDGVYAYTGGDYSDGVYARTYGNNSEGVFARTEGYLSEGFQAYTYGDQSDGFRATTYGNYSEGFYAKTYGEDSTAVYGESSKSYGVYGEGSHGGYFTTNQPGEHDEENAAIKAETDGDWSRGVYVNTSGDYSAGVISRTFGEVSPGVYAHSDQSYGVVGETRSSSYYGGLFTNSNGDSLAAGTSGVDIKFRVSSVGDVYADGSFNSGGADFAEMLPAVSGVEEGDVLVVNQDGLLEKSSQPGSTSVMGVYSQDPALVGNSQEDGVPLAITGIVHVKATMENGEISPGDLLTSSSKPGYAMKAEDPGIGTVIGKSLESLDEDGMVKILVTLQ